MKRKLLFLTALVVSVFGLKVHAQETGDYYIQNASSGLYLCGANSWGTQASVANEGALFNLTKLSDGIYTITHTGLTSAKKELGLSNGELFADQSTPAGNWTIEADSDGKYTISYTANNKKNYLVQSEEKGLYTGYKAATVETVTDAAKWYILTRDKAIEKLSNATQDKPLTASFLIKNPGFNRNTSTADWSIDASRYNLAGGLNDNFCAESWHATLTLSQTIPNLPAGVYKLTAQAFCADSEDNPPYIYIKDDKGKEAKSIFPFRTGTEDSMDKASQSFIDGKYFTDGAYLELSEAGSVTIGVKSATANFWCIWDNFDLTYYGSKANLNEAKLKDFIETAEAIQGKPMDKTVADDLNNAVTAAKGDVSDYDAVINSLYESIKAARQSIIEYESYKATIDLYAEKVKALDNNGQAAYNVEEILDAYNNGTLTEDFASDIMNAYISAVKAQTTAGANFTGAIINNSFETGDLTGWVLPYGDGQQDTGVKEQSDGTYTAKGCDGKYLFNIFWKGCPVRQTISDLPNGLYRLNVLVSSDGATIYLTANGGHNEGTETGGNYPTKDTFQEASYEFEVTDGTATIGVVGGADGVAGEHKAYREDGYWWYKADNFRLTFLGSLDYFKTVYQELKDKVEEDTKHVVDADETMQALQKALSTEPVSVKEYKDAIEDVQAAFQNVDYHAYDEYFYENQTAERLGTKVADELKNPTTAKNAEDYAHKINVLNYNTVVEKGYRDVSESVLGAWKDNNVGNMTSQHWDGTKTSSYFEQAGGLYDRQSWDMSRTQDITTLKPGEYILQVAARVSAFADATLSVTIGEDVISTEPAHHGDVGLGITTAGVASYNPADTYANDNKGRGFEWRYIPFTVTEEGQKVTLSFAAEGKAQYQYVSFTSLGILTNPAAAAKTILLAEIDKAQTITDVNVGEGAFQIPESAYNDLQQAIETAEKAAKEETTEEGLNAAIKALQDAVADYKETELNEPKEGDVFNVMLTTVLEYAFSNEPLTFHEDNASGAYFPQNVGVNANRAQQITFTKVEGNLYKLSMVNAEGEEIFIGTNLTINETGDDLSIRLTTDAEKALAVKVIPTSTEGVYNLSNTKADDLLGCWDDPNKQERGGIYTTGIGQYSNINFTITPAEKPVVTLNINADKYGTVIFPFVPNIPEGADVVVYTINEIGADNVLAMEEVDEPKANVPYILYSETGCDVTVTGYGTASADTYTDGFLTGVYSEVTVEAGNYVLQTQNGKQGFYKIATGSSITAIPYRAYLSNTSEIKAFYFGFDDATAIEAIPEVAEGLENAVFYNLSGQRVQNPTKGIYIVNGKKVLVK